MKPKFIAFNDELSEYARPSFNFPVSHVIYVYRYGSYEGDGTALIISRNQEDGCLTVDYHDMCHCSCYGPFERYSPKFVKITSLAEFRAFANTNCLEVMQAGEAIVEAEIIKALMPEEVFYVSFKDETLSVFAKNLVEAKEIALAQKLSQKTLLDEEPEIIKIVGSSGVQYL